MGWSGGAEDDFYYRESIAEPEAILYYYPNIDAFSMPLLSMH
jgi:hypothetical protein